MQMSNKEIQIREKVRALLERVHAVLNIIQGYLNFEGMSSPQFQTNRGLGKIGTGGFLLGVLDGASIASLFFSIFMVLILNQPPPFLFNLVCILNSDSSEHP